MDDVLIDPPHIKEARKRLAEAGIDAEVGNAVLDLASLAFRDTQQVNQALKYKKERDDTPDELERVSEQLVKARKEMGKLSISINKANELINGSNLENNFIKVVNRVYGVTTQKYKSDAEKVSMISAFIHPIFYTIHPPMPKKIK